MHKDVILITGGLGFIAMHAADALIKRGCNVVLMDNLSEQIHGAVPSFTNPLLQSPNVRCLRGDVRSRKDWIAALEGVDEVLHLAAETGTAQSMHEIGLYTDTNVNGTALLLDILANQKHKVKKIILASSRSVYGEGAYHCSVCGTVYPSGRDHAALRMAIWEPLCPNCSGPIQVVPTREDSKLSPASIYAVTKLSQEHIVRVAGNALGIATVILRLQNVYGEGQSLRNPYTGILSIFANKLRQRKPIYLYEDGLESRDFVHVQDVANAITLAATLSGGDGEVLNVGSGQRASIAEVARLLKGCYRDSSETEITGEYRIGDIRHNYADLTAIRTSLTYKPEVTLEAGLNRLANWVETQAIEPDRLHVATNQLLERGLLGQAK